MARSSGPTRRRQPGQRAALWRRALPTPSGRARFIDDPYIAPRERRELRYPLVLNTGRLRDQWHGMSRTGTAARLFGHVEQAQLGCTRRRCAAASSGTAIWCG